MVKLAELLTSGLMVGVIYAVIALGFVVIYKATRVFNFAQGSLALLGAFVFYTFVGPAGLPLPLAALLSFLVLVGVAWIIERLSLRPLIGQPILAPIIVTLALTALFVGLVLIVWGSEVFSYPRGILPTGIWRLGRLTFPQLQVAAFVVGLVFIALLSAYFRYTRAGLAMRVTAEDHVVAQNLGIKVKQVFSQSWMIAGAVATVGGIFLGGLQGVNDQLATIALKAVAVVLIGGLESITGAIVAGLMIGVAETLAGGYLTSYLGGGIADTAPYLLLMAILLIKPYGFFGLVRIERL